MTMNVRRFVAGVQNGNMGLLVISWRVCRTSEQIVIHGMAMPKLVYFDTDAFHRIGQTFASQGLAEELREKILLSPITFLEVLSHLTLTNRDAVLLHIQAVRNW